MGWNAAERRVVETGCGLWGVAASGELSTVAGHPDELGCGAHGGVRHVSRGRRAWRGRVLAWKRAWLRNAGRGTGVGFRPGGGCEVGGCNGGGWGTFGGKWVRLSLGITGWIFFGFEATIGFFRK